MRSLSARRRPSLNPTASNRCLAGVDEAGLGPILGPLVVAGAGLEGPPGTDPWQALEPVVARSRPRSDQIVVADSKKVKQGPRGLERLERTVLVSWAAWHDGELPETVGDLLDRAGVDRTWIDRCPWYEELDHRALPIAADSLDELALRGHLLRRCMDRAGIAPLGPLALRPVDVEEFNASIAATDNKSTTHFEAIAAVLGRLLEAVSIRDSGHVMVDRCGGRAHYRSALGRALPDWRVLRGTDGAMVSTYELRPAGRDTTIRVTFAQGGEERAFPTALASCMAKYVRELLMTVLNEWFTARIPGLQPTAGYYVDGQRFLADIAPWLRGQALPAHRLVRVR